MEDTNQNQVTNVNTAPKIADVRPENDCAINAADDSLKHEVNLFTFCEYTNVNQIYASGDFTTVLRVFNRP